jgi:hypothetical protein
LNHGDEVHRLRVHANVSHDARDIEEIVDDARRRLRVALDKSIAYRRRSAAHQS